MSLYNNEDQTMKALVELRQSSVHSWSVGQIKVNGQFRIPAAFLQEKLFPLLIKYEALRTPGIFSALWRRKPHLPPPGIPPQLLIPSAVLWRYVVHVCSFKWSK